MRNEGKNVTKRTIKEREQQRGVSLRCVAHRCVRRERMRQIRQRLLRGDAFGCARRVVFDVDVAFVSEDKLC